MQVAERTGEKHGWRSRRVDIVEVTPSGIRGDMHFRQSRTVRPHESEDLRGATLLNDRAVTIADVQGMHTIMDRLGLGDHLHQIEDETGADPSVWFAGQLAVNVLLDSAAHVGVNEVVRRGDVVAFGFAPDRTSAQLFVRSYNPPCRQPAAMIMESLGGMGIDVGKGQAEFGVRFVSAAADDRGWVAYLRSA